MEGAEVPTENHQPSVGKNSRFEDSLSCLRDIRGSSHFSKRGAPTPGTPCNVQIIKTKGVQPPEKPLFPMNPPLFLHWLSHGLLEAV